MKKKLLIALSIAAGLCLIVYVQSWIPRSVSLELPAVEYRVDDDSYFEQTTIRINGKITRPLFHYFHTFSGDFVIDKYEDIHPIEVLAYHNRGLDSCSALLRYTDTDYPDNNNYTNLVFAHMQSAEDFSSMLLCVTEFPEWPKIKPSGYHGLTIVAPAATVEEAKAVAENENFIRLSIQNFN